MCASDLLPGLVTAIVVIHNERRVSSLARLTSGCRIDDKKYVNGVYHSLGSIDDGKSRSFHNVRPFAFQPVRTAGNVELVPPTQRNESHNVERSNSIVGILDRGPFERAPIQKKGPDPGSII